MPLKNWADNSKVSNSKFINSVKEVAMDFTLGSFDMKGFGLQIFA